VEWPVSREWIPHTAGEPFEEGVDMPGDSTEAPTGFRQRSRSELGLNSDRLDAVERAVGVIRTWMADIKITRPEVVLTLDDTDRHKVTTVLGKGTAQAIKARR